MFTEVAGFVFPFSVRLNYHFKIFDRGFVSSKNFVQLHSRSEFSKGTCEGKEDWKLAKEDILTDIFHGFEPPRNLMKWFELRLQVFRWQPCSKKALFRYIQTLLFYMSLSLHKIDIFPVYKLRTRSKNVLKDYTPVLRNQEKQIF